MNRSMRIGAKELSALVSQGESDTIEFKRSTGEMKEAFHRTGAVEVWGRGTNRVIEMCKKHGAAPPTFEEMQGFLIVTFKAQMVQGGDPGSDIPAIGRVPVEKTVEKAVEKTVEIIIVLLRANPRITQKEIATETGLSRRGVEWNLREMKKGGLIRRVGPDKGGHWEVVK